MLKKTFLAVALAVIAGTFAATAAVAQDWKAEWDKTVAAAKGSKLNLVIQPDPGFEAIVEVFKKKYPDIRVEASAVNPSAFAPRLVTEQNSGLFAWDVWWSTASNMNHVAIPANALEKLDAYLILPEVKDPSNWYNSKYLYTSDRGPYVFTHTHFTSTLAIYSDTHGVAVDESYRFTGTHISEYDRTKADAHKIAEEFIAAGLPLVIVQPGTVIGPDDTSGIRDTLIGYLQRRLPLIPAGQSFAWAHVDDIVEGHLLAMARGRVGESYHISGDVMTLVDALDLAATMTGIPAPTLRPGAGFFRVMAGIMGCLLYTSDAADE